MPELREEYLPPCFALLQDTSQEKLCQSNNLLLVLLLRDASASQCCSPAASAATQPRLFNFHALPLVSLAHRMVRPPSVLFAPLRLPAVE